MTDRLVRDKQAQAWYAAEGPHALYLAELAHRYGDLVYAFVEDGRDVALGRALADMIELCFSMGVQLGISAADLQDMMETLTEERGIYSTGIETVN